MRSAFCAGGSCRGACLAAVASADSGVDAAAGPGVRLQAAAATARASRVGTTARCRDIGKGMSGSWPVRGRVTSGAWDVSIGPTNRPVARKAGRRLGPDRDLAALEVARPGALSEGPGGRSSGASSALHRPNIRGSGNEKDAGDVRVDLQSAGGHRFGAARGTPLRTRDRSAGTAQARAMAG